MGTDAVENELLYRAEPAWSVAAEASRSERRRPSKRSSRIGGRGPSGMTSPHLTNHVDVDDKAAEKDHLSQGVSFAPYAFS